MGGTGRAPGCTMTAEEVREKIKSGICRHEVMDIGDASSGKYVSRYIIDLDVALKVTEVRVHAGPDGKFMILEEYRSTVTYGPNIRAVAVDLYSEGVMSNDRIAEFINAVGGGVLHLSEGSIYNFCREFPGKAAATVTALEEKLLGRARKDAMEKG